MSTKLEELTLSELKVLAIEYGIPEEDLKNFTVKAALITTIRAVMNVKPVETLTPTADPAQDQKDNRRWETKADIMRTFLKSQPTVRILVPLESGESQGVVEERNGQFVTISGSVWSKTFNGYRYAVPKGKYVDVPQAIAENIEKEFFQTTHAGDAFKIDRIKNDTGRPVSDQL